MRRKKILWPVILSAFIFTMTFSLSAQENDTEFHGNLSFGYRMVDNSGATEKYKEDINLDDGARLFNFSLHYIPKGNAKKLFDRIDLNVYNFGGDPYETFGLSVQKHGKYKFQYDRKKSTYFYSDLHETGGGHLYDMHTFNFDRIMDSAFLKVMFSPHVNLYLNFDRYTKKGDSVTTFDINRIEFEFDKPIEEESKTIAVGLDFHFQGYSFIFEEKYQEFENSNSLFLPGLTDGGPGARYPTSLSYFNLNQPYDLKTNTHTFKLNARPFSNLLISGSAQLSNQDMGLSFSERAKGVDYMDNRFMYDYAGSGSFERKIQLYDFDLSYLLFNKLAIIGAVRSHDFEQDGSLTIGADKESALLNFNTLGIEGGLQYQFSPKFALTLGYRKETRELEGIETVTYEEETERTGIFGNLKWDPARSFKVTADYQHGSYDDPFTLISPTSLDKFKLTARLRSKQFSASSSYLLKKLKSEVYSDRWESTTNQFSLRCGYNNEKVKISSGYAFIGVEHKGNRTIAYPPAWSGGPGSFAWNILYEGKSNILDAALHLDLDENWKIGIYGNYYKNTGFWEISRNMLKGYIEYVFDSGIATQLGYRYVQFKEKSSGYNDYKASILEASFGYRWK